ncbi:MAG TPA: hypothetical protein DD723_03375 [Candidatus Omnitrophica bacterium]|nr:MAG: hypothetical protein A2Z81_00900 [Omnitrophica WOR_2 bacterium GWA2_45_18]HBR14571.1 hypothetical protein [Candidatus Omnitrophota bacterium]
MKVSIQETPSHLPRSEAFAGGRKVPSLKTKEDRVDVVFIYPKTGIDLGATIGPPHALLSVAAPLLKKGFKVKIVDQRTDAHWRETLSGMLAQRPICVALTSMTGTQIYFALEAAKLVREVSNGKIPIVWGGAHPSSLPEQTLKSEYVDVVCIGEGDITFLELVQVLANKEPLDQVKGIVFKDGVKMTMTPGRPLLDVETLLPVPWELVDVEKYIHRDFYLKETRRSLDIGQTSRGCPFQCGFCSSAALRHRQWRPMSVKRSLEMILEPVKRFHLDGIWIRDDEFYIDRERAYEICQGIIDSGVKIKWYTSGTRVNIFNMATDKDLDILKRSGADTLKFGAESGSNRILKLMKKGIRCEDTIEANLKAKRHGIIPVFALMIGFPTETFEDIDKTIDLFVRLKKDNPKAQFEIIGTFTAMPQTPLYEVALQHGLHPPQSLEGWIDWLSDEYDMEGKKIPWFNASERKKIGNITYMSLLANSSLNAIGGVSNNAMRLLLKLFISPLSRYEGYKLRRKLYGFSPELDFMRFLRRKVFYRRNQSIH